MIIIHVYYQHACLLLLLHLEALALEMLWFQRIYLLHQRDCASCLDDDGLKVH